MAGRFPVVQFDQTFDGDKFVQGMGQRPGLVLVVGKVRQDERRLLRVRIAVNRVGNVFQDELVF